MTSETTWSLLQLALQFTSAEQRSVIKPAIVDALADRHNRLLKLGRAALSEDQLGALEISESKSDTKAPDIVDALFGSGFSVPQALALDDKSVTLGSFMEASDYQHNMRKCCGRVDSITLIVPILPGSLS